jgi:hypothetical protein
MEGYCSTGQSPQRAVVPLEEEEVGCAYNRNHSGLIIFFLVFHHPIFRKEHIASETGVL